MIKKGNTIVNVRTGQKMTLSKYYSFSVIIPSIFALIAALIFSIIDNVGYKSEWMTTESVILMMFVTSFVYCLIICILALTIFLLHIKRFRKNKMLTMLSWFLLPIAFMAYTTTIIYFNGGFNDNLTYLLLLNIPFILGLLSSYFFYRNTPLSLLRNK